MKRTTSVLCIIIALATCKCTAKRINDRRSNEPVSVTGTTLEVRAHSHGAEIHFPSIPQDNDDHHVVRVCNTANTICTETQTSRDSEFIPIPAKGEYQITAGTCSRKDCTDTGMPTSISVSASNSTLAVLQREAEQLKAERAKNLTDARAIFVELNALFRDGGNDKGQQSVEYLRSLSDPALIYLLSDLAELPLDDPDQLATMAQRASGGGGANADDDDDDDDESTREQAGAALLTTTYVLAGVVGVGGVMAVLKRNGDIFKYLHTQAVAKTESRPERVFPQVDLNGDRVPGELGSNHIKIGGREFLVPTGYKVTQFARGPEASALDAEGNTRFLGRGSQGTVYSVVDGSGSGKIIKFSNRTLEILQLPPAQAQAEFEKLGVEMAREDVDVADQMKRGFGNPMEARMELIEMNVGGRLISVPVVIKDVIKGQTLKGALEGRGWFFSEAGAAARFDLEHGLFQRMAKAQPHYVYPDLNPDNLRWHPGLNQWVVIDAKPPIKVGSEIEALRGNFKSFRDKLAVGKRGTIWSRDGIRVLTDSVARYSPVYSDWDMKLATDAMLMHKLQSMEATIGDQIGGRRPVVIDDFSDSTKVSQIVATNSQKLTSNRNMVAGVLAFGAVMIGTAVAHAVLTLAGDQQKIDELVGKLGALKKVVRELSQRIDALTAKYIQQERSA